MGSLLPPSLRAGLQGGLRRNGPSAQSGRTGDGLNDEAADVCLILEATYPYVRGGVSSWVHDLVTSMPEMTFALVCLLPNEEERDLRYDVPRNVTSISHVYLQSMQPGGRRLQGHRRFFDMLERTLLTIQESGGLTDIEALLKLLAPHRKTLGENILMQSPQVWDLMQRMYERTHKRSPFLEYFWTWRGLFGPLFSVMLADLPKAHVYHTVSTGYAGAMAARARVETGRPAIVTEHGIYTNERRIEITLADWIYEAERSSFSLDNEAPSLKEMWKNSFLTYSRACYQACNAIYTIYGGNQRMQKADGAPHEKMQVIPNGVDLDRFFNIQRSNDNARPTIALIGRVVSIKDIKTFIRACARLQQQVLDLQAWIMGPFEEEPDYYTECAALIRQSGLEQVVSFTGSVNLIDYFPHIDVVVLTSISEGQPLVLLEAGAAGIPCVATDVGACREILAGKPDEEPPLGPGGAIIPLANPTATAEAIQKLLNDREHYGQCSAALRERTRRYYSKVDMIDAYRAVYEQHMALPDDGMKLGGATPAGPASAVDQDAAGADDTNRQDPFGKAA